MKRLGLILIVLSIVLICLGQAEAKKYEPNWESLSRWEVPQWFEDAVLGIYCHWGVYSVPGFEFTDPSERVDSGLWYGAQMYNPENVFGVYQHHLKTYGDPAEFGYKDFVPMFTAEKWDPDAWAEFFKSVGTDFAGLAFEHGDGFCLWDTEHDAFNAADMGPKRDIAGDLFRAARKQGMRTVATFHKGPGSIYSAHGRKYCPPGVDVNNEKYADLYGPSTRDELYNKLIEVIDKYRPDQLWFEGAGMYGEKRWKSFLAYYFNAAEDWGKDVVVTQKSTDEVLLSCTVLDVEGGEFPDGIWRWAGMTEPQKQRWQKDVPIGNYWAYADGVGCRPVNMLVDGIVDRISKNGVTLLDVAPKADGTLPEAQINGLKELGKWMAVNKEALYAAKPAPFVEGGVDTWSAGTIRFTEKGPYLYAIELGNEWPTTLGFADYGDSKLPSAPYTIPGVKPIKGSEIQILGSSKDLPWRQEGENVIIDELPDPLPCDHAWSFKIQVLDKSL
jgi:alpha-L-fucosidase